MPIEGGSCQGRSPRWWFCEATSDAVAPLTERTATATDWWFSERSTAEADVALTERARAVCRGCPVRQECYSAAGARHEADGVWGGAVFPGEYRQLRRLALRAAAGGLDAFPDLDELDARAGRLRRRGPERCGRCGWPRPVPEVRPA